MSNINIFYAIHDSDSLLKKKGAFPIREEALAKESEDLKDNGVPQDLVFFLQDIGVSYDDYVTKVKTTDRSKFEPKIQRKAREIYHRFRKY